MGSFRLKSSVMLRGIMTCSRGKAGKLFFFSHKRFCRYAKRNGLYFQSSLKFFLRPTSLATTSLKRKKFLHCHLAEFLNLCFLIFNFTIFWLTLPWQWSVFADYTNVIKVEAVLTSPPTMAASCNAFFVANTMHII